MIWNSSSASSNLARLNLLPSLCEYCQINNSKLCFMGMESSLDPDVSCNVQKSSNVLSETCSVLEPRGADALFLASLRFCMHYCIDSVIVQKQKNPRFARFSCCTAYNKLENDLETSNKQTNEIDLTLRTLVIHTRTHTHIHTYTHAHTHVVRVCVSVCVYMCVCVRGRVCAGRCVCVWLCGCM